MKIQPNLKSVAWIVVATVIFPGVIARAASSTWTGTTNLAWLTDTNWSGSVIPGSSTDANSDVATFSNNTQLTAALDMTATNGVYYPGTVQRIPGSTGNRVIRNGNGALPGVLTLSGATLDTAAGGIGTTNVIVHQATTGGTISFSNGTGGGALDISLPNAVSYKVVIDGSGGTAGTVVFNSNITGLGGLTAMRAAGLTSQVQLLGNNSYAGDTIVDAARLRAGNGNGIPNGAGKGNLILQGVVTAGPPAQPLFGIIANETINGLSGDGFIDNDAATPFTLTIGDNNATGTFAGTIYNSGAGTATGYLSIAKVGSGTQTLSGNNTYSGVTNVSGGTLLVNGTHNGFHSNPNKQFFTDDYTVTDGATLGGTGNIDAKVGVRSGGIIAPGTDSGSTSVGTLTINELASAALSGDYNLDGAVNAADFTLWRDTYGETVNLVANGDNTGASMDLINDGDYVVWKGGFGATNDGTLAIDIDESTASIKDLLVVEGALDVSNLLLAFDVTGSLTQPNYVFASYVTLVGTFASANIPAGYTLDYNFGTANQIALVSTFVGSNVSTSVPEPALLVLLSLGILGITVTKRHWSGKTGR